MKYEFKRVFALLLTLVLAVSFCTNTLFNGASLRAYAVSTFDEDTVDFIVDGLSTGSNSGNWGLAAKDGCAPNFFHNAVLDYLVGTGLGFEKEKQIEYNQPVMNPVTERESMYGSIDLCRMVNPTKYYIWEVKPVSYNKEEFS